MSQFRLLEEVVKKLKLSNIPYMLTGSIVSSLQGVPRSTHDIDIIISISEEDIEKIISNFPEKDFYFKKETIKDAVSKKSQFNIISQRFGDKIDFWLLTDSEFDRIRFSRRQKIEFMGFDIIVSSPEDTILEKLYWSKISGGSKKHYLDALKVYEIQQETLDMNYMVKWSRKISVSRIFRNMKNEADLNR